MTSTTLAPPASPAPWAPAWANMVLAYKKLPQHIQGQIAGLLHDLVSQVFIPEYQLRRRWQADDVAMWDNRSTQHDAVMDDPPSVRRMERAGLVGDVTC